MASSLTESAALDNTASTLLPSEYLPVFDRLNDIVRLSGEALEGNLFFYHEHPVIARDSVYMEFYPKRKNYLAACRASTKLLEIGFNAGHSALLALACGVEYHGVDICDHAYVKPAAEYLKSVFGERFHFYAGNSLEVLPQLAAQQPNLRFDMVHVDGLHSPYNCYHDTHNALTLVDSGALLLIDDTDLPELNTLVDSFIADGLLKDAKVEGWEDYFRHRLTRKP